MARIADKHGLTNKYRSAGTGKRNVKRGRPRKHLIPHTRKRSTPHVHIPTSDEFQRKPLGPIVYVAIAIVVIVFIACILKFGS